MGGSTRALPVSPRYRTPHLWPSPRTTAAQAQVLARPAPNLPCRPWACAGADLRVHAPHPRPEQLGLARGSSWATNLRILPTPRVPPLPRPSLDVGRASAWPLPLAPPPPLSGLALKSLIVMLRARQFLVHLSSFSFPNVETEKSNILKRTPFFTPLLPEAHINGGLHIELSRQKNETEKRKLCSASSRFLVA